MTMSEKVTIRRDGTKTIIEGYPQMRSLAQDQIGEVLPLRREVPKVWRDVLKARGVDAKIPRGKGLVVEFDCPFDHVNEAGDDWAKTRIRVNPDTGWVSLYSDEGGCPQCSRNAMQVEAWLVVCPDCLYLKPGHPRHKPFEISWDDRPEGMTDEEFREVLGVGADWDGGPDGSPVAHVIDAMYNAYWGLGAPAKGSSSPAKLTQSGPQFDTVEDVRQWIDQQVKPDGSFVVLPTLGVNGAWALVKEIPGRPSQEMFRQAQALRKKSAR